MTQYQHANREVCVWRESAKRTCACMKLQCPFQQSPSCGAHWWTGLLVWPPYVEVWGPGCHRSTGTWRAVGGHTGGGWVLGRCWGGSCFTSIVPGEQEQSRTQQESGGPFLKSDQLELLFSHPTHFILLRISSSPSLFPPSSFPWQFDTLAEMWFSCVSLMKQHSPCIPPTPLTNPFSTGIKLNHGALFFNHHVHIKVTHERM